MAVSLTTYPTDRPFHAAYGAAKDLTAFAACLQSPPTAPAADSVPKGDGHVVLVLPGFLTGDWATVELVKWLRLVGYDAKGWGGGLNCGPSAVCIKRCRSLLDESFVMSSRKVTLIGRSLGGLYARELAKDAPEKVVRVITLGTPIRFPIKTPLSPFARALSPNFDPEFSARIGDLPRNPPVPVTAIYSRADGIVPFSSCLVDESAGAENVEVDSPHTIMGSNPTAMRVIAERLAR